MSDTEKYKLKTEGRLADELGFEPLEVKRGYVKARLKVTERHLAPHGFLHAASVILLADTCAGYGCLASLPEGAKSFTTVELKMNFMGTARDGDRMRGARRAYGKIDAGVGRGSDAQRQGHCALPLHADDPQMMRRRK